MRTFTAVVIILGVLFSFGCEKIDTTNNGKTEKSPELPENYTHLDEPTWVPVFDIPEGWEVSPSYSGALRSTSTAFRPTFIEISLKPEAKSPAEALDEVYNHQYCDASEKHARYNIFTDCQKGFYKSQEQIGGYNSQVLRYYGTWRNKQDEVVHIFLQQDNRVFVVKVEGYYAKAMPAVEQILKDFYFEWKRRERSPDSETRGGL